MEIDIDGIKVGAADEIKYVGMYLNHSLTMRKRVATVCSKVSRNISLIRMNRKFLLWSHVKTSLRSGHGVIR